MEVDIYRPRLPWGNGNEAEALAGLYRLSYCELEAAANKVNLKRGAQFLIGLECVFKLGKFITPLSHMVQSWSPDLADIVSGGGLGLAEGVTMLCLSQAFRALTTKSNAFLDYNSLYRDFTVVKKALGEKNIKPPKKKITIRLPDIKPGALPQPMPA